MSYLMSTYAVAPDSGFRSHKMAWFMMDNGQVWCVNSYVSNVLDRTVDHAPEISRLEGTQLVRVNADDTAEPGTFTLANVPDGPLSLVHLGQFDSLINWCTDGQYIYFFDTMHYRIRRIDLTNLRVDTLVGGVDTHPDLTRFYDSHDGRQAYINLSTKSGYEQIERSGAWVDRDARYLYWWDWKKGAWSGDGNPPIYGQGVGGYIRRMSLDGSHAVSTVTGFVSDVQHPSPLVVRNNRFWFNSRDSSLGESYDDGYHGISSVNMTGGDYRLHYVDARNGGADDPCGFCNAYAPMEIVNDSLITGNNAGVAGGYERDDWHRWIAFDMNLFDENPDFTFVHRPEDPLYETTSDTGAGGKLISLIASAGGFGATGLIGSVYRDGATPLAASFVSKIFSRSRYPGWEDKILFVQSVYMQDVSVKPSDPVALFRVLEGSDDIWDVTVLFTATAFKGYDHVYPQTRSDPMEFQLEICELPPEQCIAE